MRNEEYYYLAAIKSYFLAHEYHNEDLKTYVKDVYFSNIFDIYDIEDAYDDNNKILIKKEDFQRISIPIIPLIKSYMEDAKVHPKKLSEKAFKISDTSNDGILRRYTKNFTKNDNKKGRKKIFKKAHLYKKHIFNLNKIHTFDMVVSFDFEYNELNKNGVSEMGISIYRPQENTIEYKHFIIEGKERTIGRKASLQKLFGFGETETKTSEEAFLYLESLLLEADVFLAHDIINELQILNIKPNWSRIIDTKVCELILDPQDRYLSLKDALLKRRMTASFLHNAGNDAASALHLALQMYNEINFKGNKYDS